MAREIITRVWCDACAERDEQQEGQEVVVQLTGKPMRIALCEVDRKALIDPLATLLKSWGVAELDGKVSPSPAGSTRGTGKTGRKNRVAPVGPAVPPTVTDDPFFDIGTICQMTDCGEISRSQAGLTQHLRTHHNLIPMETYREFLRGNLKASDVAEYRKKATQVDYICRHEIDGAPCNREFLAKDLKKSKGAFAAHLRKSHGLSIPEAEAIHSSSL